MKKWTWSKKAKQRQSKRVKKRWQEGKGKPFWGHSQTKKTREKISNTLSNKYIGELSPAWKGGKPKSQGYISVKSPDHPKAGKYGLVQEHILVIEKKLGRFLRKGEIVHHINGKRDDNRPENLWLFPNRKAHNDYENKLRNTYYKWIRAEV